MCTLVSMGKGIIYGFSTMASKSIVKIGRTEQTLHQRLRGYIGPSKPRTLIFRKEVDNSVEAENWVKILMSQCSSFRKRHDLGDEWYESSIGISDEVRNKHMLDISEVARLAVREIPSKSSPLLTQSPAIEAVALHSNIKTITSTTTTIPGMHRYFQSLDKFVDQETFDEISAEILTKKFESSIQCPVFSEYLPNTIEYRTAVVRNRYSHMFC